MRPFSAQALCSQFFVAALLSSTFSLTAFAQSQPTGTAPNSSSNTVENSRFRKSQKAVKEQYIVMFRGSLTRKEAKALIREITGRGGRILYEYEHAVNGFSVRLTELQAQQLSQDTRVQYVQEDAVVVFQGVQAPAPWDLDRIDQAAGTTLDQSYTYVQTGQGVNIYVIDTGIDTQQADFGGRASGDFSSISDGNGTNDCNGHGTFVAALAGGTVHGVAKQANVHGVRVLDCTGSGTISSVVAGLDWVAANGVRPAVANVSLGGSANQAIDDAVKQLSAAGVAVVVAAGNSGDAVDNYSPARVSEAITVGAMDSSNTRASWSNYGAGVDLYALGVDVSSVWISSPTGRAYGSGTSFAAPLVAGLAAQYLQTSPTATSSDVSAYLTSGLGWMWGTVTPPASITTTGPGSDCIIANSRGRQVPYGGCVTANSRGRQVPY